MRVIIIKIIRNIIYKKRYFVRLYGYPEEKGNSKMYVVWERKTFNKKQYKEWATGASFTVGTSFKVDGNTIASSESGVEYIRLRKWIKVYSKNRLK